jgi:KipI family sensor histidine kinase inhibitor
MRWIRYGPDGLLVYFAEAVGEDAFARGRALSAAIEKEPPPGLREYVPSFTSVLLEFAPGSVFDPQAVVEALAAGAMMPLEASTVRILPVRYDGPDLDRVAAQSGLSVVDVVELHAATTYRVYALGFSPGFPYLGDLDRRLHTPRLAVPRPKVAAGSVAIGGSHTGIYPIDSPGGWNIIGRTEARLFAPERGGSAVFLLAAGDRVRFEPMR